MVYNVIVTYFMTTIKKCKAWTPF